MDGPLRYVACADTGRVAPVSDPAACGTIPPMADQMHPMETRADGDVHRPELTLPTQRQVQSLADNGLALPALLFVAAHRPVAFVVGQLLYMGAPLATLGGWAGVRDWAALLSHPAGAGLLEESLRRGENRPPTDTSTACNQPADESSATHAG